VRRRERRQLGEKPDPPLPICTMAVNHRYKLIYLKTPKAAGTTAMAYFTTCGADKAAKDYCLTYVDFNSVNQTEVQRLLASWEDYFVFTFVRNPLSRAISQYQVRCALCAVHFALAGARAFPRQGGAGPGRAGREWVGWHSWLLLCSSGCTWWGLI